MTSLEALALMDSPIGKIAVGCTDLGIADIEILVQPSTRLEFSHSELASQHCTNALSQLDEYFAGTRTEFDLPVDLHGTAFQQAVWKEIAKIGFGQKLTYGQIAQKLGKSNASRAVGGAVGANPVPLVIGCHRVMGSSDSITGYSGGEGVKTKRWLLKHEGIEYRN